MIFYPVYLPYNTSSDYIYQFQPLCSLADMASGNKSFDSFSSNTNSKFTTRRGGGGGGGGAIAAAAAEAAATSGADDHHPQRYLQQFNVGGRNGAGSINRGIVMVRNAIFGNLGGAAVGAHADGNIDGYSSFGSGNSGNNRTRPYWPMHPSTETEIIAPATNIDNFFSIEDLSAQRSPPAPSSASMPTTKSTISLRNGFRILPTPQLLPPPPPPLPSSSSSIANKISN